jgi:hypothetical protein
VHKYLLDGYIDALFRRILATRLGINCDKPMTKAGSDWLDLHRHWSDEGLFQGVSGKQQLRSTALGRWN